MQRGRMVRKTTIHGNTWAEERLLQTQENNFANKIAVIVFQRKTH